MYDFYGNPPKTKEQIREYLTSWLTPIADSPYFDINGSQFKVVSAFVRAFHSHEVLQNTGSGEFVWWVVPKETDPGDFSTFPTKHYPSFEALIDGVVDEYHTLWNRS